MLEVKPLRGSTTAVAKMHTNSAHPLRRPDIAPATLLFLKGKSLGTKSRMAKPHGKRRLCRAAPGARGQ